MKINVEYIDTKKFAGNKAVLIDWKYADEQNEEGYRTSYVVVVDSDTKVGKEVQHYLDSADTETDFVRLDQVLEKAFGIKDEDVVFYIVDLTDANEQNFIKELNDSNDMVVENIVDIINEIEDK